ncbi:MAG: methionyl-tRNA formyltransferase [Anaerovoracaceae bacterium]
MKVIYMGTPDFAVKALEVLVEEGHEVGYVVSQPDAAKDRGKKVKPTPVKAKALEYGIEVLAPQKIRGNEEFFETIKAYKPDLIVVAAYGKILPKEILELPPKGCINIHASILPRHRGAAPIQRAIIEGDEETGVTLMLMEEGLDTGDMLATSRIKINKKTGGELHDELSVIGAELLRENLEKIEMGQLIPIKQDDSQATYAQMIFKKDAMLDFSKSAVEIERAIRGFNPWPVCYTSYNGNMLKIWEADVADTNNEKVPGTILSASKDGIEIATGKGSLIAKKVQVAGKKPMKVEDFLRGNNIEILSVLG